MPGTDPTAPPGLISGNSLGANGVQVGPDGAPLDVRGDVPGRSDLSYDHEPLRKGEDGAMYSADGHQLALTRDGIGYYDVDAYNDGNPKNDVFYTKDGVKVGGEGDVLAHRKGDGELINPRTGEVVDDVPPKDGQADGGGPADLAEGRSDSGSNESDDSGGADDGGGSATDSGGGGDSRAEEVAVSEGLTFDDEGVPRGSDGERLRPVGDPSDPAAWVDRHDRVFSTAGELLADPDVEAGGSGPAGVGSRGDAQTVAMGDEPAPVGSAGSDRAPTSSGSTIQIGGDDRQVTVEVTGRDGEPGRQTVTVDDSGRSVVTVDGRPVSMADPAVPNRPVEAERVIRA